MTLELGITLLILVSILALGLLVYFNNKNSSTNRWFAATTFMMTVWMASNFLENYLSSFNLASFFLRLDFASAAILVCFWIFFCLNFPQPENFLSIKKKFVFILSAIFFAILSFSDLIIKNINIDNRISFDVGILFALYAFFIVINIFGGYGYLIWKYRKYNSIEIQRTQILYVLLGFLIFGSVATVTNLFLQSMLPVALFRMGIYSAIFVAGFTAYAIVKKKLFGIKVVLTALLVVVIASLLMVDTLLLTKNLSLQIFKGVGVVLFMIFGYALIKSVIKEIEQKEKMRGMAIEIDKAYRVEKKANEELTELDKVKNQFLMQTQHDLRSPLGVIRGYCDLLISGTMGKQSAKTIDVLQRIQMVAEDKIRDVNNFLDVAQFRLGKGVVSLKPGVGLVALINEVINAEKLKARQNSIYLKFETAESEVLISADREKLKASIFNIVDNAIKYTKSGGVSVGLQPDIHNRKNVLITIKDTGIGIPKDKLATMFEGQFMRTAQAQKTAEGKGIGLYLSGQIIKMHNGKVWVESEGEGKGSAFYIELPL